MGLAEWKAEFYQVPPAELEVSGASVNELLDHCLLKWEGARQENLTRHGVIREESELSDPVPGGRRAKIRNVFRFDGDTCALCYRFNKEAEICDGCPLDAMGLNCFKSNSPFAGFAFRGQGPEAMIEALRKARYGEESAARRKALDEIARDAYEAGLYDRAGIPEGGRDE